MVRNMIGEHPITPGEDLELLKKLLSSGTDKAREETLRIQTEYASSLSKLGVNPNKSNQTIITKNGKYHRLVNPDGTVSLTLIEEAPMPKK